MALHGKLMVATPSAFLASPLARKPRQPTKFSFRGGKQGWAASTRATECAQSCMCGERGYHVAVTELKLTLTKAYTNVWCERVRKSTLRSGPHGDQAVTREVFLDAAPHEV